jgi:cation diffusion facilitator CzcD-associated flavoprotein CzcO
MVEVAVIGAGAAGLVANRHLLRAGHSQWSNVRVWEAPGRVAATCETRYSNYQSVETCMLLF